MAEPPQAISHKKRWIILHHKGEEKLLDVSKANEWHSWGVSLGLMYDQSSAASVCLTSLTGIRGRPEWATTGSLIRAALVKDGRRERLTVWNTSGSGGSECVCMFEKRNSELGRLSDSVWLHDPGEKQVRASIGLRWELEISHGDAQIILLEMELLRLGASLTVLKKIQRHQVVRF